MILRRAEIGVDFGDGDGSRIVKEAFLHKAGSASSVAKAMVGIVFDQAIVYFLLFQPHNGAVVPALIKRPGSLLMIQGWYKAADAGVVAVEPVEWSLVEEV